MNWAETRNKIGSMQGGQKIDITIFYKGHEVRYKGQSGYIWSKVFYLDKRITDKDNYGFEFK